MSTHLVLTVRMHGDARGTARYHGMALGAPEWPPSPARVFSALVAGVGRAREAREEATHALRWLERLPSPLIAAPRRVLGQRVSLFVPNNDADAVDDPRDVGEIRTSKAIQPSLFDDATPFLYAWPLSSDDDRAREVVAIADELYQLGRGVDVAWATGEIVDDEALEAKLAGHRGTVHRPAAGVSGRGLACPTAGSLASLDARYGAAKLRIEGEGKKARVLFTNAPKPRFASVVYAHATTWTIFELRPRVDEGALWPWPLSRASELVELLRDSAVAKLREGLPGHDAEIEQMLVGRKRDGSDAGDPSHRVRIVPLASIGHEHADRGIRRVAIEATAGAPLTPADIEWAFSGLEPFNTTTGELKGFVLTRADGDEMLRHYEGRATKWRSVTPLVLPERAARRRIEPTRQREEAKSASERIQEERDASAAIRTALRHAGVRAGVLALRVQREHFEAKGSRAEAFAEGTRFAKERLWHVELEFDTSIEGPLVLGDGRFLGLGVMAPVAAERAASAASAVLRLAGPIERAGLHMLALDGEITDARAVALALRRAVMARAQAVLGERARLPRFFSGHEEGGAAARGAHVGFHVAPSRQLAFVLAPHWLDRREPSWDERKAMETLELALEGMTELRAGASGLFRVQRLAVNEEDPLLASSRSWSSVTPYLITRHGKRMSAAELVRRDVLAECARRGLPTPEVEVTEIRSIPGEGVTALVSLKFAVAVSGPIAIGRSRFLGGGLFERC